MPSERFSFSAKFAPNSGGVDNYTTSPKMRPADRRTPPLRTASVSERIASRLKEIQKRSANAIAVATANQPEVVTHVDELDPPEIKLDKGKGKAVESPERMDSPPPMSPPLPPAKMATLTIPEAPAPILLAGLAFPPSSLSQLLTRAAAELDLRPVRFPLLGEYPDCFTGEEFVTWLNEHVPGFGGSLDRAEDAAKELTERDGLLRRIGEFGNQFEHSDEAFYQFRPKVYALFLPALFILLIIPRPSPLTSRPLTALFRLLSNLRTSSSAPTTLSILSVVH